VKKNNDFLIKSGIVFAAYFIILKPILNSLGITKSAEETQKEAEELEAQKQNEAALKKKGLKLTKPVYEWNLIADSIENSIAKTSGLDDNDEDAGLQLTRVKNDLDIAQLIKSYGMRPDRVFGFNLGNKNLVDTVKSNLTASKVKAINDNYFRKKMNFRF